MQPTAFAVFHLNLAFSAIPAEARPDVVQRCYHPLLDLVESGYPLGIELTGWTLERLQELDPGWVARLRELIEAGRCELVGSGYAQVIGPLVPVAVNRWNQSLGIESYERVLGLRPRIVLVNEMAFSSSLVGLYREAGYEGLIMDRDNVRLALDIEDRPLGDAPTHAEDAHGARLPVLWADSILFQKLQQVAHGDIRERDYVDHVRTRVVRGESVLPLYANDAEVFDFRPGRFEAESRLHPEGEWNRIGRMFGSITAELDLEWRTPSAALASPEAERPAMLSGAAYPIPVKKQAKYNLARWAVSGRNDTWINTMCHRIAQRIDADQTEDDAAWRRLCELWATDLRTHITEERWVEAEEQISTLAAAIGVGTEYAAGPGSPGSVEPPPVPGIEVTGDEDGIGLEVATGSLRLVLNRRRGLTVQSLGFASDDFTPIVGTLPHGYFRSIALGADFYSGGVVVELADQPRRVTDLDWVAPTYRVTDAGIVIEGSVATALGPIEKAVTIPADGQWIELAYRFPGWSRPRGFIRAGTITLLPDGFDRPLHFASSNGGDDLETFDLDRPVDHPGATSSLISSTAGLGATDGRVRIGQRDRSVDLSWDPAACAALPMVLHQPSHPGALTRVFFSLLELDDTLKPGGPVPGFTLRVSRTP